LRLDHLRVLTLAVGIAVAGCSTADRPTAPASRLESASALEQNLLACPTSLTQTATGALGMLGGTIQLGDVRFTLPAGAVRGLTVFVVTVPASRHLEVEIHALGLSSFHFEKPATITMGYGRCGDVQGPFRAWYIDSETKALLEDMGGVTDTVARTHTFQTNHLSGYAVAN
jgi:hypothetical protein